ncbi:hypothetical protein FOZ62_030786 [Perkinsus olseni]|uniref:Uncharacterized protein n=1 Tax=Perkinsus olseni TaxID=32597 RepID=A0A7J6PQY2_PEROL|nr:hypothetical protein FOZ62_030786 [Perkinsus olseni]
MTQLVEGVKTLGDPRLGVLVLNTLITNVFVYPFQTAAVPVILRQMDPVNWKSLASLASAYCNAECWSILRSPLNPTRSSSSGRTLGVSLGGVIGPILSNASAFLFSSDPFAGLVSGITAQIATGMISVFCVMVYPLFPTGTSYAVLLSSLWVLVIAANNQFTIFFNSLQQMILPANQRGKFIANLLAVFTMGNAAGLWVFGQAIASPEHLQSNVCWVLVLSVVLRIIVGGIVLYRKSALRRATSTTTEELDDQLSEARASTAPAVRYETLESVGGKRYAYSQMWQNLTRTLSSQVAGVVTDNAPPRATYVCMDVIVAFVIAVLWMGSQGLPQFLSVANLALGVAMAFSGPVGKSLPPSVVEAPSELPMVNSFELTGDKIGRYIAPFAVSFFLMYYDFPGLVRFSIALFMMVAVVKASVKIDDAKTRKLSRARPGLLQQLVEGVKSLRDPSLGVLVLNTMLTNVFVYPFQTAAVPVILRQMDPVNWKSLTSLVSLGGVLGPVLSNLAAYHFRDDTYKGLVSGLVLQIISVLLCLGSVLVSRILLAPSTPSLASPAFTDASTYALWLCVLWVAVVAANNHFTVFFNSIQQRVLPADQRGRFIANILALFTMSNAGGLWLYGQAISSGPHLLSSVSLVLAGSVVMRLLICAAVVRGKARLETRLEYSEKTE